MSFSTGTYIITSNANNCAVGRYPVEDRSPTPKEVFAVAPPAQPPRVFIQDTGDGYVIKAQDAPFAVINDKVFSILRETPRPEAWLITPQPQHGLNVYIVEKADHSTGWVVITPQADPQRGFAIGVRPLVSTMSLPPQFPPNELFTFNRVDND
ncbi:hypothetical protein FRB98_003391 [Tulasnella sp. 332]|nr:hypothetical protein FRB98_003391 [Tulasnella sp. 332]